jgi:hypothetical protein
MAAHAPTRKSKFASGTLALRTVAAGRSRLMRGESPSICAGHGKSLKLEGEDFEVWWNLGEAYYWNPAKKPQAEHAFRQCISLGSPQLNVDPRDVEAMSILAVCHAMLNDRKAALDLIQKALALGPVDAELSFKAAIVYTLLHDEDRAVQRLGEAIAAGYPARLASDTPVFDQLRSNPRVQELFRSR